MRTSVAHLDVADEAVDGEHDEAERGAAGHDDQAHDPLRDATRAPAPLAMRASSEISATCGARTGSSQLLLACS